MLNSSELSEMHGLGEDPRAARHDTERRAEAALRRSPAESLALPEGVDGASWAREQELFQNPRIRGLLRCVRILESVSDSEYSIMHCSLRRLFEIWDLVRKTAGILHSEVAPLLMGRSQIPALEAARSNAAAGMAALEQAVLGELAEIPAEVSEDKVNSLRELLCRALAELNGYVKNSLSSIVSTDPRSQFDADYFSSRRFSRDVDEAEWLYSAITSLEEYVRSLNREKKAVLAPFMSEDMKCGRLAVASSGARLLAFVEELQGGLAQKLRATAAIPGIRCHELELLERNSHEIAATSSCVAEIVSIEQDIGAEDKIHQSLPCPTAAALARAHRRLVNQLDQHLYDLSSFVAVWKSGVGQRRSLLLRRPLQETD